MHSVEPESVGMCARQLEEIPRVMQGHVDRSEAAGISTLVARRGKIVHLASVGCRDIESGAPMTEDTICRIYSMTKPITGVAALQLYERGAFQLDDPVAQYIPAFRDTRVFVREVNGVVETEPQARPMTLRHLMTHTAGLMYPNALGTVPERMLSAADIRRPDEPLAEKVTRIAALPLDFQPGVRWKYSLATDVLGYLVEVISGMPLDVYMQERIFDPLGMTDTGFWVPPERYPRYASVYGRDSGSLARLDTPGQFGKPMGTSTGTTIVDLRARPAYLSGGGGLTSTIRDYARFAQMLLNGGTLDGVRILGRKTVATMTANHLPTVLAAAGAAATQPAGMESFPFIPETWPFPRGYGMGLTVRAVLNPAETGYTNSAGAFTWQGAASTDFWVDPKEEMIGVLMMQRLPGWYRPAEDFKVMVYAAVE